MKCTILHEGKGRMRVHVEKVRMTLHRADVLEAYLNHKDAIIHAAVYERTGDVVITYTGKRTAAIAILAGYKFDVAEYDALVTSADSRRLNREYQDKMFDLVAGRCLRKLFLPAPLDAAYTAFRSIRFLWKGVRCVLSRRLEVEVLDALSIGVSLLRGDFGTAGSVMFLLNLGSLLEEWTRKKSLDDLARSMALNVDKVWVRSQGTEVLVPLTKVRSGDEVVVRSGNMIPLDGTVLEGEAMVNQAALTGEAMPVRKTEGSTLYAGTVVEEGECVFIAKAEGGSNRYDKIVAMIEESEKLKSSTENRALVLADKLVPWCLGATVVTYLLTRNATRAISCLMVDFSCALKLSMPIAVLSAMKEASDYHLSVKGGRFLEAVSDASTIVFDKTGTLTQGRPEVIDIIWLKPADDRYIDLLIAAETQSQHPLAKAIVSHWNDRIPGKPLIEHFENISGKGIEIKSREETFRIGNRSFVFTDSALSPETEEKISSWLSEGKSVVYYGSHEGIIAIIATADRIKKSSAEAVTQLQQLGIEVYMLTGDNEATARSVAQSVGITRFKAEVLPQDKEDFVSDLQKAGKTVAMVGDGINDSQALACADVSIAMGQGTDIAMQVAMVTLMNSDLLLLTRAIRLSRSTTRIIRENLFWAFIYNVVCIPIAAGILFPINGWMLNPMWASAAMAFSSVSVVLNSLRLKWK